MGLILDSSILVAAERRGETVKQIIERVSATCGDTQTALSVVTIFELTHGIYRAKTDADTLSRKAFVDELICDMVVHPISLEIAQLAGQIEGERAARGISIAVEDLLIGATALYFSFSVATFNVKHFQAIPGLSVVSF